MTRFYTAEGEGSLTERIATRQPNGGCIPLSSTTVEHLLLASAVDAASRTCDVAECDGCNEFNAAWWNACNALSSAERIAIQKVLRMASIPLPEAPWEEVR